MLYLESFLIDHLHKRVQEKNLLLNHGSKPCYFHIQEKYDKLYRVYITIYHKFDKLIQDNEVNITLPLEKYPYCRMDDHAEAMYFTNNGTYPSAGEGEAIQIFGHAYEAFYGKTNVDGGSDSDNNVDGGSDSNSDSDSDSDTDDDDDDDNDNDDDNMVLGYCHR